MEASFVLQSSMSPKVTNKKKPHQKHPPSRLALKKFLRRSSIYDKKSEPTEIILVENSSESGSSSEPSTKMVNTSPIVISDSEEEIVRTVKSDTLKSLDINDWLENVHLESTKDEEENTTKFSEVSSICPVKNDGEKVSANSTFVKKENGCRFDEMFRISRENEVDVCSKSSSGSCISFVEDSFEQKGVVPEKPDNKDHSDSDDDEDTKRAADVLDELYGKSWRANKEIVLTPVDSNKNKKQTSLSTASKPSKSLVYKNPYTEVESTKSKTLLRSLQKARIEAALASPWVKTLKDLCESDDTESEKERHIVRKKLNFQEDNSDKENFSDLDQDDLEVRIRKKLDKKRQEELLLKTGKAFNNKLTERTIKKVAPTRSSSNSDGAKVHKKSRDLDMKSKERVPKKSASRKQSMRSSDSDDDDDVVPFVKPPEAGSLERTPKTTSSRKQSLSSSNSDDEEWWKPSRKSELQLSREIKTTKTFSFLASLSKTVPAHQSDPSALIYCNNFTQHRDALLKKLFKMYNETIFDNSIPKDTPLEWNPRMRGTAGYCYCKKIMKHGVVSRRSVRIVLSTKVLDSADRLRDTLVHEMCHAATYVVNEVSDGHGTFWKAWAAKARRVYPELPPIKRCHDYDINTKYTYKCVGCGYSIGRHSKSLDIERKRCGYCYGKFEVLLNKKTRDGKIQSVPSTPGKANGFALFVKENYADTKSPNLTHAEVMKLLGQKFAELKIAKSN